MIGATREDALIIAILRDGAVFLGTDHVTPEELPGKIAMALSQGAERNIYIRADARARCKSINPILEVVQSLGVLNVGILTDQRRTSYPAQPAVR